MSGDLKSPVVQSILSQLERLRPAIETSVDATAWFLGPKAENGRFLQELVAMAVQSQINLRKQYMPDDPQFVNGDTPEHEQSIQLIRDHLSDLLAQLMSSIPLASYRNLSHMYWDITLPGAVGYFAGMLYNQNNVAAEASPVTTMLEIQVGNDLCEMLFGQAQMQAEGDTRRIEPWGHITCDGSVANGESMWAARNLKYLPVAVAAAINQEAELAGARIITVRTCRGTRARLTDLNVWELLNLPVDEVIGLIDSIVTQCGIDQATVLAALTNYSLQNIGLVEFRQRFLEALNQATPVVLVPATAHYSWAKSATLLGLGFNAVRLIEVDLDGRMSMLALRRELDRCLHNGTPVLQVVAVVGSTEEGAIDPLHDIVRMRREYQEMGLNFVIHVDGAWGGYFTSILRKSLLFKVDEAEIIDQYPELYVSDYFRKQYSALPEVDSVTLDPHKSGFIPYPAGGLCYRNGNMRMLIKYASPVVFHGGIDPTVGAYGIEGSKPGAAATSVYLSHKVIPLNSAGYGRLLGRCLFNSKRFYAALVSMDVHENKDDHYEPDPYFTVTPFQRLPVEKQAQAATAHEIFEQKIFLKKHIVPLATKKLIETIINHDKKARALFQEMGSDLSIVAYAFNFKVHGRLNRDLALMNELNDNIFRALSLQPEKDKKGEPPSVEMFVTSSSFDPAAYGRPLVDEFAGRAGIDLATIGNTPVKFLISTTQNPWLTSNRENRNMVDVLVGVLRETILQERKKIIEKYSLKSKHD